MTRFALAAAALALSLTPAMVRTIAGATAGSLTHGAATCKALFARQLIRPVGRRESLGYGANGGHQGWTEQGYSRTATGANVARLLGY